MFLTLREAAEILRLSESRVRQLVRAGELPSFQRKPHGKILFRPADLQSTLGTPQLDPSKS